MHRRLADAVRGALQRRGVTVLTNEHRVLEHNGAAVAVAGVEDLWSREADLPAALRGIPDGIPRVVLAHNPATIAQAEGLRCDLMLSGHTHGGQIRIPSLPPGAGGPQAARFAAGLYLHDSGYLYVNRGIGYTFRFRYKVRPEIALFELRRKPSRLGDPPSP
jgi:predicted MPP superfamily phosphohydrolase